MSYYALILVKGLQKYQSSKLGIEKNLPVQLGPGFKIGQVSIFSNFQIWPLISAPWTNQYLIWKILNITAWSQKHKGMAWYLIYVIMDQS